MGISGMGNIQQGWGKQIGRQALRQATRSGNSFSLKSSISLIEEISKVVYSIYPLIGTPSNEMTYAFCYHFQLDDPLIQFEEETNSFHFIFFRAFTSLGAWSR